ncbi:MAG: hypothetical protein DMF77_25960 [Acidobacteria bacterium]|nr:MAG: hypothetical protein DMF77_25960 [Acidobacteriota bacterium]
MPVLTDPMGWFTVEVPDGWNRHTEDCVTTLRSPRGIGLLYLSAARHSRGRQDSFGGADFLSRFLRSLGLEVEESEIALTPGLGCRIYTYARRTESAHWTFWSVTDDETALLMSYACSLAELGRESEEVEGIVRSARLYHSAPLH